MKDCTEKLHSILRSPEELARAFSDFARAWGCSTVVGAGKAPGGHAQTAGEPFRATGEAAARLRCPVARRVILKTEKHWSGK